MVFPSLKSVNGSEAGRRVYSRTPTVLEVPNLIQAQLDSFKWFRTEGLKELFEEISPMEDYPGGRFELNFLDHTFDEPATTEEFCRENETTYSAALKVRVELVNRAPGPAQGERKFQDLFIGDIPMMTRTGTFIINGAERVVVSQLVRSPGAYFTTNTDANTGRELASAKMIPNNGAWMEFETSNKDIISVKIDRKRKSPAAMLLRALGYVTDEELLELFSDVDNDPEHQYIQTTIDKDVRVDSQDEAMLEFYRRLRPGEPPSIDNAKKLLDDLFFNPRRYDLGRVGRYKVNMRLGLDADPDDLILSRNDIISLLRTMIEINNGVQKGDDIDHLGNRRVRSVGELIQKQVRVGLLRMERVIKERMTTQMDPSETTPAALINVRPVVAAVREFFGGSQLSQFMQQTNPLDELTHKRRLSALGPGGLSRERAGFDVRDVHHSHYGRICPIETPEGPNIGLLGSMATYAKTNEYGFLQTPYRRVKTIISSKDPSLVGRTVTQDVTGGTRTIIKAGRVVTEATLPRITKLPEQQISVAAADGGEETVSNKDQALVGRTVTQDVTGGTRTIIRAGRVVSKGLRTQIVDLPEHEIAVKPYLTDREEDIVYLTATDEENIHIAQATAPLDDVGQFLEERVETRIGDGVSTEPPENIGFMDVSPMQLVSVSTALIPFLEHDDANRALMGSNMQRQAVPLLRPEPPLVGTGLEGRVARDSGQVVLSKASGVVTEASGENIVVTDEMGEAHEHRLRRFVRSNQGTCINQRPMVDVGDIVEEGQFLADSSSTAQGELALGQNVLVAFMSWEGYNFEDAIVISERLVKDDRFTSIHIEKHEVEARDTKLGPEEVTRDIPNVGEENLRNLDEEGVIRIGAEIGPGDILVGKITPKGETELSAEEKLLRAIFGEKARDVRDTSLRVPHGERGKVIDVKVFSKEDGDELSPGVNKMVRLWVAQTRKIAAGDKMAGRHGNKGVISQILPEEDLPFLPDGTPVDIILNPIGVPARMNLGQVLETHLGQAAHSLGFRAVTPVFDGASDSAIEDALGLAWMMQKSGAVSPQKLDEDSNSQIDLGVARAWIEERGYSFDKIVTDPQPGEARKACLEIWFQEELGRDVVGMTVEQMKEESLRLNRDDFIAAPILGKSIVYDGRTGEPYDQPIAVGYIYMMKLIHLVEDKIHARSTGPYSLITQQPLGGKAQFGGQRFGEMEVWALEAYSAAYNLQEMLTVKSDDVLGRVKTYEAIVKGEDIVQPGIPESFHVLLKELQSLGLSVELMADYPEQAALEAGAEMLGGEPTLELVDPIGIEDGASEPIPVGAEAAPADEDKPTDRDEPEGGDKETQ